MANVFTESNFEQEVLKSDVPVLVDFWAPWCRPCNMLSPTIDSLSKSLEGAKVGKVNVDENRQISQRYGVSSIPTLIFFKNGLPVETHVGVLSEAAINQKLNTLKG